MNQFIESAGEKVKGGQVPIDKLAAKGLIKCDHCGQPKQSHRVCSKCGYYAGREIHQPVEY